LSHALAIAGRATRLAGAVLAVAGALTLLAALVVPWRAVGGGRPDPATTVALVLLGPLLTGLRLALWSRPTGRPVLLVNALAGLLAAGLAAVSAARVDPADGIGPGGPLAMLGGAALALGWLLVALAGAGPLRPGPAPVAAALALLLGALAAGVPAVRWYTADRGVDRATAAPLPDVDIAPPLSLDRERWRAETPSTGWFTVAGRYVVVGQPDGVRVLDALTGAGRWHYRRDGAVAAELAVSADRRTTLVLFRRDAGRLGVALDTATGQVRWRRAYPGLGPARLLASGDVLLAVPAGGAPTITALDVGTGALRWTWRAADQPGCAVSAVAAGGGTVAVAQRCGERDAVQGLSTVDGKARWTWRPEYGPGLTHGDELTLRATGAGFLVGYGQFPRLAGDGTPALLRAPRAGIVLSAATGAATARHESSGTFTAVVGGTALYLGSRATAVDLATGRARWSRPAPELDGWTPVTAVGTGDRGYLLLRGPAPEGVGATAGGPTRLLVLDLRTGEVRADRPYALWGSGCLAGGDGRPRCDELLTAAGVGPGVLVVLQASARDAPATRLAALG
jgi:outer membrane protein assembly factor BamB